MSRSTGQAAGTLFDSATRGIMPESEVTVLHLLRHGDVEAFDERRARGQLDVALSELGREQSRRLARWFARCEAAPQRLVTSDLTRCAHLGELLAGELALPLETSPELREQSMGRWEGRTWKDITEEDGARVTAYWDNYAATRPPEGESFDDLVARAAVWWRALLAQSRGQRVVAVSHIGFIRATLCHLFGMPSSQALRLAPAVASHTAILWSEPGPVLVAFGERPWLFEGSEVPS